MSVLRLSARKFPVSYITLLSCILMVTMACARKQSKCQNEECTMKPEHFKLYSNIKRALNQDFDIKGKDLIGLIRSIEILQRRFANQNQDGPGRLNGTELVEGLLADSKLHDAMNVFTSDQGRQLINLYKTSINGNHQNLACSSWRVGEIKFASQQLEKSDKLTRVFANVHKNFLERSARKCLKSSCGSIDDNMNRLDSVLRRSSKRRGFLATRDETLAASLDSATSAMSTKDNKSPQPLDEHTANSIDEAQLIAQLDNEPAGEFQREESELCRFLKRNTNTSCQASGNELSEISFIKPVRLANETVRANLTEYIETYRASLKSMSGDNSIGLEQAGKSILGSCRAIMPTLEYHLFGLRWYQQQGLIGADKLRSRTFWCPSLSYWIEIERLCGELKSSLSETPIIIDAKNNNNTNDMTETFAY